MDSIGSSKKLVFGVFRSTTQRRFSTAQSGAIFCGLLASLILIAINSSAEPAPLPTLTPAASPSAAPIATPQPYMPSGAVFIDPKKFPLGSDARVAQQALESLIRFEESTGIGAAISTALQWRYPSGPNAGQYNPEWVWRFGQHPWTCGNKDTEIDWISDSMRIMLGTTGGPAALGYFLGCMTPKVNPDHPRPTLHLRTMIYGDLLTGFSCWLHTYGPDPSYIVKRGNGLPGDPTPEWLRDNQCCPSNPDVMEICELEKTGYHLEMLWPTNQISINDYNISGFDPTYECGNAGLRNSNLAPGDKHDAVMMNLFLARHGIVTAKDRPTYPGTLRSYPNRGQSLWGGMQPEDQTYSQEAHVYRTYIADLAQRNVPMNKFAGYDDDCHCFYNAVEIRPQRIHTGWTESLPVLPFWRTEELSANIDYEIYKRSVPVSEGSGPAAGSLSYYGTLDPMFPSMKSCAAYRVARWPTTFDRGIPLCYNISQFTTLRENLYADMATALGVRPMNSILASATFDCSSGERVTETNDQLYYSRQCFRGGGDLYPLTGKLSGHFSELPAAALLARRAIEYYSNPSVVGDTQRINAFSDNFDKLQRIYPLYPPSPANAAETPMKGAEPGYISECFRTNGIPNYLKPFTTGGHEVEGDMNWPKDAIRMDQLGEKRFVVWDRKRICMCPKMGRAIALKITCGFGPAQFDTGAKFCLQLTTGIDESCQDVNDGDFIQNEVGWRTDGVNFGRAYGVPQGAVPGLPEGIPFPFFLPGGGESCNMAARPTWCPSSYFIDRSKHGSFCGRPGAGGGD